MRIPFVVPSDPFLALLARLPPDLDLEALARQTKAFRRARGVRCGADLLRLALAWARETTSLQSVAAWAGAQGIAQLTDEALVQRLHKAVDFLAAIVSHLLPRLDPLACWHGRLLRIADSTGLSQTASRGTDWRIHAVYDLGRGGFAHLEVTDGHGAEALDRGAAVAGEVRIGDRGFANAQAWQRWLHTCKGAGDFIVRLRWNTVRLHAASGAAFALIAWLQGLPQTEATHEIPVLASVGPPHAPLPIRLIARRKTPHAIARAHKQLRRRASRNQSQLDPRSLVAAEYVILATSLPAEQIPAAEVLAAYRLRWQIELAFKRLKSLLRIDAIRTHTAAGTQCWLYAQLIVALLCDGLCQEALDFFPQGAV